MNNSFDLTGFVFNNDIIWEDFEEGVRRKIMAYEKDLMLVIVEFKKGSEGSLHKHPHKQVSYVAEGSFKVNINGEIKVQKKGDVFLILPNIEHGVTALEDGTLIDIFSPQRKDFLR